MHCSFSNVERNEVKLLPVSCVICSGDNFDGLTSDIESKAQDSNVFANHQRKVWSFAFSQNLPVKYEKPMHT
jgi:hypothetical protein